MNPFGRAQMVMYVVYVLQDKYGKSYKGLTSNIEKRLQDHISGHTRTTSLMDTQSLHVVYKEIHNSLKEARVREKYLKSSAGRRFLKKCSGSSDG